MKSREKLEVLWHRAMFGIDESEKQILDAGEDHDWNMFDNSDHSSLDLVWTSAIHCWRF